MGSTVNTWSGWAPQIDDRPLRHKLRKEGRFQLYASITLVQSVKKIGGSEVDTFFHFCCDTFNYNSIFFSYFFKYNSFFSIKKFNL